MTDEEFTKAVRAAQGFIDAAIKRSDVQIGCNLNVVSFPLGRDTARQLPLRDDRWIDQHLLEFIFFWSIIDAQSIVTLPALDPNPAAFERVFPSSTVWPADSVAANFKFPAEVEATLIQGWWQEARSYVSSLRLKRKQIDGLPHFNVASVPRTVDGYFRNVVRLGQPTVNKIGMVIEDWNQWVSERSPQFRHGRLTIRVGKIRHSGILPSQCDFEPVDDPTSLKSKAVARRTLIQTLVSQGRTERRHTIFIKAGIREPSAGELAIVSKLFGRALSRERLASEVSCDRFTLHKKGWLPRLIEHNVVICDRHVGGYYLPDFPPIEANRTCGFTSLI